jgi:hypothetical protein
MADLDEPLARRRTHPLRRRIRRDQLGMLRLQRLQLAHQRVIFGVGDLRRIQRMVQVFVMPELLAKSLDFLGDGWHAL